MKYRVKELRCKNNLSQEKLAQKAGVSHVTIVGLENETDVGFTVKTLEKVAKALGVSISDIFFDDEGRSYDPGDNNDT